MVIGVPKEIKKEEYRVGLTPSGVEELKRAGHTVLIESSAGEGSGFSDDDYLDADADVVDRQALYSASGLIVKVKEPLPEEFGLIRKGQAIFTYLHLAPNLKLAGFLLDNKITALAYETLGKDGGLPLLSPMSEIAGRMAPLMGAYFLQKEHGGNGILPTGSVGVRPARALILGAGTVGSNAARVSCGIGMDTVVINRGNDRLRRLDELTGGRVRTVSASVRAIRDELRQADIVICAVLVPGGRTPVLISREMIREMKNGAVIVDVSIDQGGCAETSQPTTHSDPVYTVNGVVHYAVANMPGAYPRTSTTALTDATLPYIRIIADAGIEEAIRKNAPLRSSLNTYRGHIVHRMLAEALKMQYQDIEAVD